MKPCPKCGRTVEGKVYGGDAAFGCGEYDFEVECKCGVMFNVGPFEDEEKAMREGWRLWDERYTPSCTIGEFDMLIKLIKDLHYCSFMPNCSGCKHKDEHDKCSLNLDNRVAEATSWVPIRS